MIDVGYLYLNRDAVSLAVHESEVTGTCLPYLPF